MTILAVVWFVLVAFLLCGFAVLDGFDLGAGFWHLFLRTDEERRKGLNAIGPVWDGNEVWLLTGAGALFAAFPAAYATVFSGFYLAMMMLLTALILRPVAIEVRSRIECPRWRSLWDHVFGVASTLAALLLGVALANVVAGIPLDARGTFTASFWTLLNPFALATGLLGVAVFALHGGLYLAIKTDGGMEIRLATGARSAGYAAGALLFAATTLAFALEPQVVANHQTQPLLWLLPLGALASLGVSLHGLGKGRLRRAFGASTATIVLLFATAAASLFPNLVPSRSDAANSITIMNGSSSETTLLTMLIVALVGMPLVIGYTVFAYRTFRGKVRIDEHSY